MKRLISCAVGLLLVPSVLGASTCPAAPDHSVALDGLIEQAQTAADQSAAQALMADMWALWMDAPDEPAQSLLDQGLTRRTAFDFLGALEDFNRLIAYCPTYAEGYNQRAFVYYLQRDFSAALDDLDRALALSPKHIAARSGRALALLGLSRLQESRAALLEALSLNPWLQERGLLAPGGPLSLKEGPTGKAQPQIDL